MKKLMWGNTSRINIDNKTKRKLLEVRNRHGLLNANRTLQYLIDLDDNIDIIKAAVKEAILESLNEEEPIEPVEEPAKVEKTIEEVRQQIEDMSKEPIKTEPEEINPDNIQKVVCPKCENKFFADISRTVVCPECGFVGKGKK